MELLLDAEADTNAADAVGCSALHYCLLTENLDGMRLLLEHDANLHVFDKVGIHDGPRPSSLCNIINVLYAVWQIVAPSCNP